VVLAEGLLRPGQRLRERLDRLLRLAAPDERDALFHQFQELLLRVVLPRVQRGGEAEPGQAGQHDRKRPLPHRQTPSPPTELSA
jgi:hypothetical protein